jgi:hypothetical protein
MSQRQSRASRRVEMKCRSRYAKGESRASRKAKLRFRSSFAKGKSKACRRAKTRFLEVDLQKVKVEHVEEGSRKDIEVETIDHIYN